ncbi:MULTISPECIES: ABC transporter substrate-binding protein [unclassified Rhizobium]|jgi:glycine betaine/proline transport system substrate-binding protein|nr:ABC transporter substrate-binding protein [Rhizobium sp. WW_1]RKD74050.1 glycine betaine/proline transport system substrate-binding protein [Rhizobium sp. WW_1]
MTTLVKAGLIAVSLVMTAASLVRADEPIKISMNNWTSQNVLSHVAGILLEKKGFEVEYIPSDGQLQFQAIADGDLDFQIEVWEGSHLTAFNNALATGNLVDYGTHAATTREDWWYPEYVKGVCPGLPSWEALNKCAKLFATAETGDRGRFVGPPADWGKHYAERIAALKMNFEEVPVGQAATLWAELQAAYDRKEPIVLFNWTPNFIEARFKGEFVEFPQYSAECLSDPKWGSNPDAVYDCGAPANGYLKKAAWKGLETKWPAASQVLKQINFTNEQIAAASAMVDVSGLTSEDAAAKWVAENESVWTAWMK